MNFETDTATLAAVALFFVLQLMVYVFCLIRLSIIKRVKAPRQAQTKTVGKRGKPFRPRPLHRVGGNSVFADTAYGRNRDGEPHGGVCVDAFRHIVYGAN